jgi:hypothetical protein
MKKTVTFFLMLFLWALMITTNASALPMSVSYWMPSDDTAFFSIKYENAGYESDFGIFAYDDPDTMFQIIDKNENPGFDTEVFFKYDSGWQVSLNNTDWSTIGETFGFYYGVYTGGKYDSTLDYLWYSDSQYNRKFEDGKYVAVDTGVDHVRTIFDGFDSLTIQLDDQLGGGDRDWDDMTVRAHDLQPVPEPATLLLLGSGLVGVVGVGRKKWFKK